MVRRWHTRWGRSLELNQSEKYILNDLKLNEDYEALDLPAEDEIFGNRADPYYHGFVSDTEPINHIIIYREKSRAADREL